MSLKPTLTLAHSPDADDVVMWWPLGDVELGRAPAIDTGRWLIQPVQVDIQEANERAIGRGDLDITAISAHTYPHVQHQYRITSCGASMGENYGPKLVCRGDRWEGLQVRAASEGWHAFRSGHALEVPGTPDMAVPSHCHATQMLTIAVPGTKTTAFLVLSLMLGHGRFRPLPMRFDRVADAVLSGQADAGLLIHEAQLTFEDQGLKKLADLGEFWNRRHGLPLPLGLNVIRRDLDTRFGAGSVDRLAGILSASVRHAVANREASRRFLLDHPDCKAEWEDAALLDRYLRMYVSPLSVDMGQTGRLALATLFKDAADAGLCPAVPTLDVAG